jgi:hypothetical protein
MPLKLNIAISRKVGEPNYGSRGATVGLEMEVDSSLVDQPKQLHERTARLFRLAKQSIDRELGCRSELPNTAGSQSRDRSATVNQIRAMHAITNLQNLNLADELRERFQVERPEQLTLEQASQMIDAIKLSPNGSADQS